MPPAQAALPTPAVQQVEITGRRPAELMERRQSTAAKIVIGREEIERFGDASLGDLLKRLPGVTVPSSGQIRMRGLGNGYTQILLDGERVQAGLSLDSLDPEQIERIEIIRAPTAETGARAIAGTINIITREGAKRRLNDVKLSMSYVGGEWQPRATWSRDDKLGEWDYSLSLSASAKRFGSSATEDGWVHTVNTDPAQALDRTEHKQTDDSDTSVHARGRLQWRGSDGQMFTLTPMWVHIPSKSEQSSYFEQPAAQGDLPYNTSQASGRTSVSFGRLNALWRHALGAGRLEWRAGLGGSEVHSQTLRQEWGSTRTDYDDSSDVQSRTANLGLKHSLLLESDHSLVSGLELERERRDEQRLSLVNGVADAGNFGETFQAQVRRVAAYAQDEWTLTPQWSAHAGLRWEGLSTQGESADGSTHNRSTVWSPLLHALWKPEPKSRDQVRLSLTRSYRSPSLSQLIGAAWSSKGDNSPTNPDSQGNPDLRPELATGLDVALERYLPGDGMFSVAVFHRRIQDLIRSVVTAQPQAGGDVRYVSQPQNMGKAITQGVELEAKFSLSQWWPEAKGTDLRTNLSLYRSRVAEVPGPNNRLDQQADGTLNLGLDHQFSSQPLTVGGNFSYTPGYTTRLSDTQWAVRDERQSLDLYAQWQLRPDVRWRVSVNNALARSTQSTSTVGSESATTLTDHQPQWRVQLELKL
jgi:outer membrane receptor for ferrienterochelin and colicins